MRDDLHPDERPPLTLPERETLVLNMATRLNLIVWVCLVVMGLALMNHYWPEESPEPIAEMTDSISPMDSMPPIDTLAIVDGIHIETGLVVDENYNLVRAMCTPCHSGKLITQNRATRDGWKAMIRWMQETQDLWDLGENEDPILDYLAKHYAPEDKGRRAPLTNIAWYDLEA